MQIFEFIILAIVIGASVLYVFYSLIGPFVCKKKKACGSCPFADGCGKK